ncbi:transposase [Actinoplanes sp. NPDC089786]|uniref:IS66 family transposase n=1 Tax=Actinoplanes sp. NPDC089786 TaxID=3155185 RepID=UPI003424BABD
MIEPRTAVLLLEPGQTHRSPGPGEDHLGGPGSDPADPAYRERLHQTRGGTLAAQHHIPVARVVEILADLAGIEVSAGWVMTACARMAAAVEPANEAIKDAIGS